MGRAPRAKGLVVDCLSRGPKRWEELVTETGLGKGTLSMALRNLRKSGEVERCLVNEQIHWKFTDKGILPIIAKSLKYEKERIRGNELKLGLMPSLTLSNPEAYWDLVKDYVESSGIRKYLRKANLAIKEDEFMKNLQSYVEQTRNVFISLWLDLVVNFWIDITEPVISVQVFRAFFPNPPDDPKIRETLTNLVDSIIDEINPNLINRIKESIRFTVQNLEILSDIDVLIEGGKLEMGAPLSKGIKKLEEIKIQVEKGIKEGKLDKSVIDMPFKEILNKLEKLS